MDYNHIFTLMILKFTASVGLDQLINCIAVCHGMTERFIECDVDQTGVRCDNLQDGVVVNVYCRRHNSSSILLTILNCYCQIVAVTH